MVSPAHNDHQNRSFPLSVRQDSLNNLSLNDKFHTQKEEKPLLFIQNPSSSSSSSSAPLVLDKGASCKTSSIEHVWDEIFHEHATNNNNNMRFQEQLPLGETTSSRFEQVLACDGNIDDDQHNMVIGPGEPFMSIDQMAMDDSLRFKVPEMGNYLDNHHLQIGFPALPLQVERKGCKSMKEAMEKSVERRQRRMIKNRESAARSRARKQAHTKQLEDQVSELRRRNNWLKQLKKEAERVLNSDQQAGARYQLRRTTSSPF